MEIGQQNKHVPNMVQSNTTDSAPLDKNKAKLESKMAC